LPEYAKPFYEELLKQTGKQVYQTDAAGNVTGVKEFTPYTGERLAGFTPEQEKVQREVSGLTTPGGFGTAASGLGAGTALGFGAAGAGLGSALGYTPTAISGGLIKKQLQMLQCVKLVAKVILKDLVVQWVLLVVVHLVVHVKL
jgi:hypothetical protein